MLSSGRCGATRAAVSLAFLVLRNGLEWIFSSNGPNCSAFWQSRARSFPAGRSLTPHHLYFFFGRFALLGISGRNRLAHNEFLSFSEPLVLAMRDQRSRLPRICFADGYIVSRQCNVRTAAEVMFLVRCAGPWTRGGWFASNGGASYRCGRLQRAESI